MTRCPFHSKDPIIDGPKNGCCCFFQDRGFDTFANNMIKYSILFPRTAERVMWPDFSRVFPFAGRRFFARKTFFPVWKRRRNVSICSLSVPLISSLWSLVFIAMLLVLSFFPMYCLQSHRCKRVPNSREGMTTSVCVKLRNVCQRLTFNDYSVLL